MCILQKITYWNANSNYGFTMLPIYLWLSWYDQILVYLNAFDRYIIKYHVYAIS